MKRRYLIAVAGLLGTAAALSAFAQNANQAQTAKQAIIRAALHTWDTTPEGARALVRLLKSVRAMRQAGARAPGRRRR